MQLDPHSCRFWNLGPIVLFFFGHPCCLRVLRLSGNPFHGLRGCSAFPAPAAIFLVTLEPVLYLNRPHLPRVPPSF